MLAWMAVIALLSTDLGSEQHTTGALVSVVRWLSPAARTEDIAARIEPWSWAIRKLSHVTEYAVLAGLACRWLLRAFSAPRRTWQLGGLAVSGVYAALDELHQFFVLTRSGSSGDVLVDLVGATLGMVLFAWHMARGTRS